MPLPRFRRVLPIGIGFVSAALMVWDYHNQRVIESMGMAWDIGPPIWPYRASSIFLVALNAPAYVLATPLFLLHHLQLSPTRNLFLFPLILVWWWWIGTRVDYGILGRRHYQHPKLVAGFLAIVMSGLIYAAMLGAFDAFRWWREYGRGFPFSASILMSGTVGPVLWCFVLSGISLVGSVRLIQGRFSPSVDKRPKFPRIATGVALVVLYVIAVILFDKIPGKFINRDLNYHRPVQEAAFHSDNDDT